MTPENARGSLTIFARVLSIVARDRPELFAFLRQDFARVHSIPRVGLTPSQIAALGFQAGAPHRVSSPTPATFSCTHGTRTR